MTNRQINDFYPTPHSIIRVLLKKLTWPLQNTKIWEPCCGDGRFTQALTAKGATVISHDITKGQDFFKWSEAQALTLITNPPFKVIRPFIDHAFSIGVQRMALICPERLWACGKGQEQWNRHRPSLWANLTWREDYLGKGGSPDRALAIAIWTVVNSPQCQYQIWNKAEESLERNLHVR